MNCVIDNPMCDGTSCANCKLAIVERQRNLAEETLTRVETERLAVVAERDEARQDFRDILGKTDRATMNYYIRYRDWVYQEEP